MAQSHERSSSASSVPDSHAADRSLVTDSSAVDQVFGTYELLQMILGGLKTFQDVARAERVCKSFQRIIRDSGLPYWKHELFYGRRPAMPVWSWDGSWYRREQVRFIYENGRIIDMKIEQEDFDSDMYITSTPTSEVQAPEPGRRLLYVRQSADELWSGVYTSFDKDVILDHDCCHRCPHPADHRTYVRLPPRSDLDDVWQFFWERDPYFCEPVNKVFETTELLEMVLKLLPLQDLARAQRVSKLFNEAITHSRSLGHGLELSPKGPTMPHLSGSPRRAKMCFVSEHSCSFDIDIVWKDSLEAVEIWSSSSSSKDTRKASVDRLPLVIKPSGNELWRRVCLSHSRDVSVTRYCSDCPDSIHTRKDTFMGAGTTLGDVYEWLREGCQH